MSAAVADRARAGAQGEGAARLRRDASAEPAEPARSQDPITTDADLIHFSSVSGNTAHFVEKLGIPSARIPLYPSDPGLQATRPYVLVVPTYGGGDGRGAVPKQVIRFLNDPGNRSLIRGVIAAGNTNFGTGYGLAGDVIAEKCHVPVLYRFELFGTPDDVDIVRRGLELFWTQQ